MGYGVEEVVEGCLILRLCCGVLEGGEARER